MDLIEQVYVISRRIPRHELYGLTLQLTRAAVSAAATIAEGNRVEPVVTTRSFSRLHAAR